MLQTSTQSNLNTNLNHSRFGFNGQSGYLNTSLEALSTVNSSLTGHSSLDIIHSRSGETEVAFSSDLTNALSNLNVRVEGFGSTNIHQGIADFRITGGAADIDTGKVDIIHDGGLTFTTGDVSVNLTDFIISNLGDSAVITGAVTINNDLITRVPLFDLLLGDIQTSSGRKGRTNLNLGDVNVTLTGEAANALNQAFNVSAFADGLNIGTADVDVVLAPATNTTITDFSFDPNQVVNPNNNEPFSDTSSRPFDIARGDGTSVAFSDDLVNALTSLQVQVEAFGKTNIQSDGISFPITGGIADIDGTKVDIVHDGGITLSDSDTTVDLTDFIVTNLGDRVILTAAVTVNDDLLTRAALFDLQIGSLGTSNSGKHPILNLDNVQAKLTDDAANLLNQTFGVSAFTQGFNIGTADVEALLG